MKYIGQKIVRTLIHLLRKDALFLESADSVGTQQTLDGFDFTEPILSYL